MDISQFKNNALVKKIGIRDYRLENTPASAMTLPYSFSLRNKITDIKDQGSSSSCVGQAVAYYVQLLNYIETNGQVPMSARDVYSLIYQPEGGAYVADACKKVCNSGCVPEADATSYYNGQPPTEPFMRLRSDINPKFQNEGMEYLAKKYVTWDNTNLDLYKQAIIQGNGMVAVTWGNNNCFSTGNVLIPDTREQLVWRHGIYFTGYDDTTKKFEFVNSWGKEWGSNGFGYLPYDYVTKGYVSNPVTLIDLPNETWTKIISQFTNLKDKVLEFIKNFKK